MPMGFLDFGGTGLGITAIVLGVLCLLCGATMVCRRYMRLRRQRKSGGRSSRTARSAAQVPPSFDAVVVEITAPQGASHNSARGLPYTAPPMYIANQLQGPTVSAGIVAEQPQGGRSLHQQACPELAEGGPAPPVYTEVGCSSLSMGELDLAAAGPQDLSAVESQGLAAHSS